MEAFRVIFVSESLPAPTIGASVNLVLCQEKVQVKSGFF
ncbi:MAG: hypothetical protein K0R92_1342 [Lachnospiraceae bacterium]|jgi:hypothetical protein|nr:hypothetical protein [Lachnospiraceae bacterium]